jgi:hypothetical protein
MTKETRTFKREKETKHTVVFAEQADPGKPPIVGSIYVQKWFAGTAQAITVTVEIP